MMVRMGLESSVASLRALRKFCRRKVVAEEECYAGNRGRVYTVFGCGECILSSRIELKRRLLKRLSVGAWRALLEDLRTLLAEIVERGFGFRCRM